MALPSFDELVDDEPTQVTPAFDELVDDLPAFDSLVDDAPDATPTPQSASPELIASEAQRATGAALQAVDAMAAPTRFDWSDVNERFDTERERERQGLLAQAQLAEDAGSGTGPGSEAFGMRNRAFELRNQMLDTTTAGRAALESEGADLAAIRATDERTTTPAMLLSGLMGPGLQSSIGPVAESFAQNAAPAIGGVLGAAAFTVPQTSIPATIISMLGGFMGAQTGTNAQEAVLRSAETPEETAARQIRWQQDSETNPNASMLGTIAATAPFFRPSPSNLGRAVYGDRTALKNIAITSTIGGATEAALAKLEGRPIEARNVALSALGNALLSEPTRLGRALGFRPTVPSEVAEYAVYGPREDLQIDVATAPEVAAGDVFANVRPRPRATDPVSGPPPEGVVDYGPIVSPEEFAANAQQRQRMAQVAPPTEVALSTRPTTSTEDVFANVQPRTQPTTPDAQQIPETAQPDGSVLQPEVPRQNEQLPTNEGGTGVQESGQWEVVAGMPQGEALPGQVTSNKEAVVNVERAARGLDPVLKEAAITNAESIQRAQQIVDADPNRPQKIMQEARAEGFQREISLEDSAVLLVERTRLKNSIQEAYKRADVENADAMDRAIAQQEIIDREKQLDTLDQAAQDMRSTWGRFGQLWQRSMREDFTLEPLKRRARVSKGEDLTPQEEAKITKISEKATQAQAEVDAIKGKVDRPEIDTLIRNSIEADEKVEPAIKSLADRIIERLDTVAKDARKSLSSRLANLGAAPDPLIVLDVAKIAAARTAKAAIKFGQWSAEMISEFGEKVRPFLQAAWDQREKYIDEMVGTVAGAQAPKVGKRVKKAVTAANQMQRIETAIDARIKENGNLVPYVKKLAKEFVRSGITDREKLVDAVHAVLSPKIPNLPREQTMDLISGYGTTKALSKEPVDVTLRDISGQLQQAGKLRDIANGIAPKKTGVERRVPSAEERAMIKQVNAAKKKFGVVVTDPETQLKSAQDAVRSSLRNSIEDMTLELETGQRAPEQTPLQYSQDMEILRGIRDRVRSTLEYVNGPKKPTQEQQIAAEKRALEASIAGYDKLLAGQGKPDKKQPFRAKENDALRAKRDALKAQLEEMNAADAVLQENRKAEALVRQIEAAEQELIAGSVRAKQQGPESELVSEARAQLAKVREQIATKRASDPAKQREAIDRAEQAMEKAIANLDAQIQAGDISVRQKKPGITSDRLEYLRAQKAAMTKLRQTLRNEAKPRLDVEELAIRRRIAQLANNEAKIRERTLTEDFAPRSRKDPRDFSERQDYLDALARRDEAKREFLRLQEEWKVRNMTASERVIRGIKQTWDATRNLWLSVDLSAPLQNILAMASHPVLGLKALGSGFRAFGSELVGGNYAKRVEQRIANSPNAKNGLYRKMKLDLSEVLGEQREENMGSVLERLADLESRWAGVPDVVKGLYGMKGKQLVRGVGQLAKFPLKTIGRTIKASNAGFGAISNQMRARTADAILARWYRRRGEIPSREQLELIGEMVNVATGKGGLRGSEGLRAIFFAPNYYLSIIKQLTAYPLLKAGAKHQGRASREIAEEYIRAMLTAGSVWGLAWLFNNENNPDFFEPKSNQFLKYVTDQGTSVDLGMGRGSYVTAATQSYTGEQIDSRTGKLKQIQNKEALENFMSGRFAPHITRGIQLVSGKDFRGRPQTKMELLQEMVTPLGWGEFDKLLANEGMTRASFLQLLNFIGVTSRAPNE